MMTKEKIEFAKLYVKCKASAVASIDICYHPDCESKSINSHILQKNGILSTMTNDSHLWEHTIDQFKEEIFTFKKRGLNNVFSFNCYCNEHDTNLFKKIESSEIDFNDYESCLLFTLRTIYNEIFRKEVNLKQYQCYLKEKPDKFDNYAFKQHMRQEALGLGDLKLIETDIWNDFITKKESFVFEHRLMAEIGICMSSFYTYDTTEELNKIISNTDKDAERTSEIFINLFPYKKSAVLMMAYNKRDEKKLKGYFYSFFKEKEKFVQRKITNLVLFNCETWVASDKFYKNNIKDVENDFGIATKFSLQNTNERQTFDMNFYKKDFKIKLAKWSKKTEKQL